MGEFFYKKIINETKEMMGEKLCSFRCGRGCIAQIVALKQISEMCQSGESLYL